MLSALAKVHAQARLPVGEGFEQLLHDAASSHNTDLQLRAVQIQSMFECVSSSSALPCQFHKHTSHALPGNIGHGAVRRVRRSRNSTNSTTSTRNLLHAGAYVIGAQGVTIRVWTADVLLISLLCPWSHCTLAASVTACNVRNMALHS